MAEQSKPAQAWSNRVAFLRDASARASEFADLLATVDPRWHGAVQAAIYGNGVLGIGPAEGMSVRGAGLRVRRTRSGFSMDLTRRQSSFGPITVARARPALPSAPMVLARMLRTMFEEHEVTPSEAGSSTWDGIVGSFRAYAAEDAAKASLLESVAAALRERCEIYDNGHAFGVIRAGDTSDGEGIWISQVSGGWSFIHRVGSPEGNGTRILGEATAGAENAAGTLNGLLEEMASRMPAPELSAQDAYRELLRAHVAPALRLAGYTGSGGFFRRTAGEHQVSIHLQKSEFSTRARVDYRLNISVVHLATAELFSRANKEAVALGRDYEWPSAGMYTATLPQPTGGSGSWISLRPGDDLAAHATTLLADIHSVAFPAIEEQLHLPLRVPTPPAERAPRPSTRRLPAPGVQASDSSKQPN